MMLVVLNIDNDFKDFFLSLNLLISKPMFYVCNVDEKSILSGNAFTKQVYELAKKEYNDIVIVSADIESQISLLEEDQDKEEMIQSLGLKEKTLNKVIYTGYKILNLITFFTSGPKETRAWTVNVNTKVSKAAGKIHSDFEKGFIRAETISYNDFIKYEGESNCRNNGKLRQEGKDYIVKDGDIFHFLFNN